MTTLTMDKLHDMMRQLKVLPPVPPSVTIWPSDYWPRDHVADAVYPYRGHPFWQWLRRKTGMGYGLTMERGCRIYQDKPMAMDKLTGAVYCSHRQAHELKRAIAAQK